ncbi:MAG: RNase adapter RapZ [Actinomycetota bacterium]|nr:RNase adapter RapZ [Actinomycetota bacterium]
MTDYLFITGLSGAGRSSAAAVLEDLGWFVIDNMPVALIPKVAELADMNRDADRVAFVIGRFGTETTEEVAREISALRSSWPSTRVIFLEATDEVIINRFESTRRRHPLSDEAVSEAIARERVLMQALRDLADVTIDTSRLNIHELRRRLTELFAGSGSSEKLLVTVVSFGFSYGTPRDVDLLFDCRFLPNPHWIPELRPHTGLEQPVRDYVLGKEDTKAFLAKLTDLFDFLVPAYENEGKSYLTVAIGCTGGRHRSVVLAEELASYFRTKGLEPRTMHRDVDR